MHGENAVHIPFQIGAAAALFVGRGQRAVVVPAGTNIALG
jgi:hypothetical protein